MPGRHPVIVISGGGHVPAWGLARLPARLATAGFVVVVLGADTVQRGVPSTAGIGRTQAQLRAVWPRIRSWPGVKPGEMVLAGWSRGGLAGLLAGQELSGITGVVSLDGAPGFAYGDSLLAELVGSTWRWRVPYLQVEAGVRGPVPRTTAALERGCGVNGWRHVVAHLAHRHLLDPWGSAATTDPVVRAAVDSVARVVASFARDPHGDEARGRAAPASFRVPQRACQP